MNGTNLFIEQLASCSKHLRHLVVHADHDSTTKKKGWTNGVLLEDEEAGQIDAKTIVKSQTSYHREQVPTTGNSDVG